MSQPGHQNAGMSKPAKVSVVVPVYNVTRYLRQCMDSIVGQTLREIEIICVDDGSTDGSGAMLDEYALRDKRVRVIHQANAGAGPARNAGMALAAGEYLFFCDPDDWCDREMLRLMYAKAVETGSDIVVCGRTICDGVTGKTIGTRGFSGRIWALPQPFSAEDVGDVLFDFSPHMPWDKIFRRSFVVREGLSFQSLPRCNDVFFVDSALAAAGRIALVRRAPYHYRMGRPSSLQRGKDSHVMAVFEAMDALCRRLRQKELMETFGYAFLRTLIRSAAYNVRHLEEESNRLRCYGELRQRVLRLRNEGLEDFGRLGGLACEARFLVGHESPQGFPSGTDVETAMRRKRWIPFWAKELAKEILVRAGIR